MSSILNELGCGAFCAVSETVAGGQILYNWKVRSQTGKLVPRGCDGMPAACATGAITVALMRGFAEISRQGLGYQESNFWLSCVGGALSALVTCPGERVMMRKGHYGSWNRALSGMSCRGWMLGFWMTLGREAPYSGGFQIGSEWAYQKGGPLGSILLGGLLATITQPFDTIRVRQHDQGVGLGRAARDILRERGWTGFFAGLPRRTAVFTWAMIALPVAEHVFRTVLKER